MQFRDVPRAITLSKQTLQHAPLWSESWYTLGLAEYHAGHWAAAIEGLEKSAKLNWSLDRSAMSFLAIAHGKLGQKRDGRDWFDQAARLLDPRGSRDEGLRQLRTDVAALLGVKEEASPAQEETVRPTQR
jgi:uncharacterized protein HemY